MLDISSSLFTWYPRSGTFSGEASTLEGELARQGRDRLDYRGGQWGFHMRSHRTGRRLWFQRTAEHRDAEGELAHVEFRACLAPGRAIALMVFNDQGLTLAPNAAMIAPGTEEATWASAAISS